MICHQNTQLFSFMTPAVGVAFSWQESKRSWINYLKLVEISGNFHINVRNKKTSSPFLAHRKGWYSFAITVNHTLLTEQALCAHSLKLLRCHKSS